MSRITIFEASGDFGPGYAYHPDEYADYLINNTTDTMCLVPSNRRAFVEWVRNRPDLALQMGEKGHLPRAVFGHFLKDAFRTALMMAQIKGITVTLVSQQVTFLTEDASGKPHLVWPGGKTTANLAILTTGRCPDRGQIAHPAPGQGARYFATHIGADGLDTVAMDATVHILGASLSAYDVVNRLFSAKTGCRFIRSADGGLVYEPGPNQRKVILCSRSGRLKGMQSRQPAKIDLTAVKADRLQQLAGDVGLSLINIADLIRQAARDIGAQPDWQSVVAPYAGCANAAETNRRAGQLLQAGIRAAKGTQGTLGDNFLVDFFGQAMIDIWNGFAAGVLTPQAEQAYRDFFETATLCFAAPCPTPTAERLLTLHQVGALQVLSGAGPARLDASGDYYEIPHQFGVTKARILVNTTGALARDVEDDVQPPLVRNLVKAGMMHSYHLGAQKMRGAAVDMQTCRLTGAHNIYLANMLLWGPGFFTSSAFLMATIVERILAHAFAATPDS